MFRGVNPINMDAKGRIAMPSKYRDRLVDACGGRLVATIHLQVKCLLIYPLPIWEDIEQEIQEHGVGALVTRLAELDSATAQRIDRQNPRRVIRALEVVLTTGKSFADQRHRTPPPFNPHVAGLWVPRDELHRRIDIRVGRMVEAGWLEEVRRLLSRGYSPELPSFSSAGYSELAAYIHGEMTWVDAIGKTEVSVHRLARGQNAWFKQNDSRIHWAASQAALIAGLREAAL